MDVNIMLDLETLGREPGCVVCSVGAVAFDLTQMLPETFDRKIDIVHSNKRFMLTMDPETVLWWLGAEDSSPTEETRKALFSKRGLPLRVVCMSFVRWYAMLRERYNVKTIPVWGNSASFDCKIWEHCFHVTNVKVPWTFRDVRCYRTWKNLPMVKMSKTQPKRSEHHDALSDAKYQAQHMVNYWNS